MSLGFRYCAVSILTVWRIRELVIALFAKIIEASKTTADGIDRKEIGVPSNKLSTICHADSVKELCEVSVPSDSSLVIDLTAPRDEVPTDNVHMGALTR